MQITIFTILKKIRTTIPTDSWAPPIKTEDICYANFLVVSDTSIELLLWPLRYREWRQSWKQENNHVSMLCRPVFTIHVLDVYERSWLYRAWIYLCLINIRVTGRDLNYLHIKAQILYSLYSFRVRVTDGPQWCVYILTDPLCMIASFLSVTYN